MKSLTKYEITQDRLRTVFEAAGIGGIDGVTEISDGWYNSVFSAIDKSGKKYVIKIAPPKDAAVLSYEKNIMNSEVKFYRLLKEKTTIKTPEIIFADFSGRIISAAYFIMEFLSGERLDKAGLSPIEKQKADGEIARLLAEFHKIQGVGYGYEQTGLCDNWKDALTGMTQALIDDSAAFGKKCKIGERLLSYIDKFADSLKDAPCVFVNFDVHSMNLFCQRTADGGIELAALDLERGFWGDPIGDLVMPELLKPFEKKNILTNYNKYAAKKLIADDADTQIRYNLMATYLAAIMYAERFSRFKGAKKYFNPVYLGGTIASAVVARRAFSALKKLSYGKR
ncbi:MAG: aminoglycoside phosphotransferase family protein [Clostridiales bacterium]|jgi:hypothetical protein|nr:aminoglycoside phosphotransferase family protein [Clostridiales bacterium]